MPSPQRMPRGLLLRAAAWSAVVAAAALASVAVFRARAEAALARGTSALSAGRLDEGEIHLRSAAGPWGSRTRAEAGLALVALARGAADAGAEGALLASPQSWSAFPVQRMAATALARGEPAAARRLASLARRAGQGAAVLDEAASAIEMGDDAAAASLVETAPETFAAWGLGRRVTRVLAFRRAHATRVVLDRRGEPLAFADAEGALHVEDEAAPWLPPAAFTSLGDGGPGIRLSVDADLSRLAAASLGPRRGTIVLLDARTGGVLAAVSDARTRLEAPTPALEQRREPASIAKIVTTAAALRAGLDVDGEVARMTCTGMQSYEGGPLWCSFPGGPLTGLAHAMGISCNVAFGNLAVRLGWTAMVDELRLWGFDRRDLPGAGHVLETAGDDRHLASLGIGLDATDITPLHAALLAAVLVDGVQPQPSFVAARDGWMGLRPVPIPPAPGRRVLDAARVETLRRALVGVTGPGGTADGVAPASYSVAMKTGTASAPRVGYHVNYIGVVPLPDPEVAFSVRITHQGTSRHVNEEARAVLATLLEGLARRSRIVRPLH